jgi:hypothetical protein
LNFVAGLAIMALALLAERGAMDRQAHWDRVYDTKSSAELSWYQAEPTVSLRLIDAAGFIPST